ncbi:hypothetical protein C8J57DRAFT_214803 [Mycena rebaudengoi]|nr:hypothetical protein C8J57DRAFT_214803 [Mycena rebaudengoi]
MEAQSTVESLLISNDPPPDAEIPVIRDIIADEQSRLLDLDIQIAALQKTLEPLVDERDATADRILRHQSVISAARRVPPEILGEIFLLTLPSQEDGKSDKASCVDSSPWLVGRICSRWREIALALLELWSTVSINDYDGNNADPSLLLRRVKMLLHRSANQPLHIHPAPPEYGFDISPEVLEILADSSPRWETVRTASNWFYPNGHMDRIKGRLDRLKSLSFIYDIAQGELFAEVPQLRRLESPEGFMGEFPWAQLTYFESSFSTMSVFNRILPRLINVVECVIMGRFEGDDTITHDIIALPALQKLYLRGLPLPPSLTAPRLREIGLNSAYLNTLPHVISRSGCDLQSVTIHPPLEFDTTFSFSALQHCPTIRDLKIHSAGDFNTLCTTLTVQQNSPIALPKLNDLRFFLVPSDLLVLGIVSNLETFVTMLKSRWNVDGCTRICHVHLEAWWHIELPFIEGLLSGLVELTMRSCPSGSPMSIQSNLSTWVSQLKVVIATLLFHRYLTYDLHKFREDFDGADMLVIWFQFKSSALSLFFRDM